MCRVCWGSRTSEFQFLFQSWEVFWAEVLTGGFLDSASPLNGEAALLWDSNQEDFKRKVLARHVEPSELEE